ncbi:hypothetical protein ASE41_11290 [Streptomyces sp. Root264]|nr:hypothetical protein ASE41_11290 [Streptomyces sp. Root264]
MFRLWRCGRQGVQAAAVLGDAPLSGPAQVVPEVPSVCDLDRLRRSGGGTFCEERRAVAADDLDAGPLGEPGGQAGCLPVREQVDRTAGFDVHQDGAVVATLAGGVFVDTYHSRCGHLRFGQRVDETQDRASADGHAKESSQRGAGPAGQGEADCGQGRMQPFGALAVPAGQTGYLLHEGPTWALGVPAPEPPDS